MRIPSTLVIVTAGLLVPAVTSAQPAPAKPLDGTKDYFAIKVDQRDRLVGDIVNRFAQGKPSYVPMILDVGTIIVMSQWGAIDRNEAVRQARLRALARQLGTAIGGASRNLSRAANTPELKRNKPAAAKLKRVASRLSQVAKDLKAGKRSVPESIHALEGAMKDFEAAASPLVPRLRARVTLLAYARELARMEKLTKKGKTCAACFPKVDIHLPNSGSMKAAKRIYVGLQRSVTALNRARTVADAQAALRTANAKLEALAAKL